MIVASVIAASLVLGCRDSAPDPNARWIHTWKATTVDGSSLPASFSFGGSTVTAQGQTLFVSADGKGIWDFQATPIAFSGQEFVVWTTTGNSMTIVRDDAFPAGRTPITLTYTMRSDGKIETTYDGHVYVLARQ